MRIGILPSLKPHDGGIYQYALSLLRSLHEGSRSDDPALDHDFVLFAHDRENPALREFSGDRWTIESFRPPWAPQPTRELTIPDDIDAPLDQPDMREWFERCGVELMIYPAPHRLSFEAGIPFIMAIHDLQHLLQPEFPEVSAGGEWRRREYVLRNAARSATLLVAESKVGREDILSAYARYGLAPDAVKILPYLPASTTDLHSARKLFPELSSRHALPERYLFYPAQFWPHKNHRRLIEALAILRDRRGLAVPLVLTGADSGEIRRQVADELKSRIDELNLAGQVRFLGYLPDHEIAALYSGAIALVMPTFFGPTNIPFLEAWSLDCPVLTSRIRGITEQVADAALTFDPTSPDEIAAATHRICADDNLRLSLIANGRRRLAAWTPLDFRRRLAAIIAEASRRIRENRNLAPATSAIGSHAT